MAFVKLTISLPEKTKKKLERIAEKQQRSQSNMVSYLIERYKG